MAKYRVQIEVAGNSQVRVVSADNAGMAAHKARHAVVEDGWLPEHIGRVRAENEDDGHDVWQSASLIGGRSGEDETMDDVKALAQEFIDYYTGRERHPDGGCGNCGGLPHSTTCFVGRFERALAAPRPSGERGEVPPSSTWGDIHRPAQGWPDGNNQERWMVKHDVRGDVRAVTGDTGGTAQAAPVSGGDASGKHTQPVARPSGELRPYLERAERLLSAISERMGTTKPTVAVTGEDAVALHRVIEAARPSGEREAPADLVALVMEYQNRRTAYNQNRDDLSFQRVQEALDAIIAWRPSPPGERPEIEVGDWVLYDYYGADSFTEVVVLPVPDFVSRTAKAIRKANGVVWRKP